MTVTPSTAPQREPDPAVPDSSPDDMASLLAFALALLSPDTTAGSAKLSTDQPSLHPDQATLLGETLSALMLKMTASQLGHGAHEPAGQQGTSVGSVQPWGPNPALWDGSLWQAVEQLPEVYILPRPARGAASLDQSSPADPLWVIASGDLSGRITSAALPGIPPKRPTPDLETDRPALASDQATAPSLPSGNDQPLLSHNLGVITGNPAGERPVAPVTAPAMGIEVDHAFQASVRAAAPPASVPAPELTERFADDGAAATAHRAAVPTVPTIARSTPSEMPAASEPRVIAVTSNFDEPSGKEEPEPNEAALPPILSPVTRELIPSDQALAPEAEAPAGGETPAIDPVVPDEPAPPAANEDTPPELSPDPNAEQVSPEGPVPEPEPIGATLPGEVPSPHEASAPGVGATPQDVWDLFDQGLAPADLLDELSVGQTADDVLADLEASGAGQPPGTAGLASSAPIESVDSPPAGSDLFYPPAADFNYGEAGPGPSPVQAAVILAILDSAPPFDLYEASATAPTLSDPASLSIRPGFDAEQAVTDDGSYPSGDRDPVGELPLQNDWGLDGSDASVSEH